MWNIIPSAKPYYTCLQCQLVDYLTCIGEDPRILFQTAHGFCYRPVSPQILSCICYMEPERKILEDAYGIVPQEQHMENIDQLRRYCTDRGLEDPILLEIDAFDCPWNKGFHIVHQTHFFWILHYDRTQDSCIVCDSFCANRLLTVPLHTLQDWHGEITWFSRKDPFVHRPDPVQAFFNVAARHQQHDFAQDIVMVKEHILYRLSEIAENIRNASRFDPAYYALQMLSYQKTAYTEYLSLVHQWHAHAVQGLREAYLEEAEKYDELKIGLLKQSLTNKVDPKTVSAKFDAIIAIEKKITDLYVRPPFAAGTQHTEGIGDGSICS